MVDLSESNIPVGKAPATNSVIASEPVTDVQQSREQGHYDSAPLVTEADELMTDEKEGCKLRVGVAKTGTELGIRDSVADALEAKCFSLELLSGLSDIAEIQRSACMDKHVTKSSERSLRARTHPS